MAIAVETVAVRVLNVQTGVEIPVNMPLFAANEVFVYYGKASLLAEYNVDYTVELDAPNFNTFIITPLASLLTKINDLINEDPTETNYVTIRRTLDNTTEATSAGVRHTPFTSREFERTIMRFQQITERLNRALVLSPNFVGDEPLLQLNALTPGASLRVNDAGNAIEPGPQIPDIDAQFERAKDEADRSEREADYAEEWAQSDGPISVEAGGDGLTDQSSKTWASRSKLDADRAENAADIAVDVPQWVFKDKATAQNFEPISPPTLIALTGGSFQNSLGHAALFTRTLAEPTDLAAPAKIQIAEGSWYRHAGRTFELEIGAKGDGITDNSNFFEDLSNAMAGYTGVVVAGVGVFKTNKALLLPKNASLVGQGKNRTIITAKGATAAFTKNTVVGHFGSLPVQIADLAADISRGDRVLTFVSAHGLTEDDLLLVRNATPYSYSPFRPTYCAAEFLRVMKVLSATEVMLTRAVYGEGEWVGVTGPSSPGVGGTYVPGGYDKDTLDVYLCGGFAKGGVRGVTVIAPGAGPSGITIAYKSDYTRDTTVEDVRFEGSDNTSWYTSHAYHLIAHDFIAIQRTDDPGFGGQYGWIVGDSQHVYGSHFHAEAYRHAIATGGSAELTLVCRDIHIHHGRAVSFGNYDVAAINWHGNTEWSSYHNIELSGGGLDWGGNHNTHSDIVIEAGNGFGLYAGEMTGADFTLKNVRGRSERNDNTRGVFDVGGNSSPLSDRTARGGVIKLQNIEWENPFHKGSFINIRNRGFTLEPWFIEVEDVRYSGASANVGGGAVMVASRTASGNAPARLDTRGIRNLLNNTPDIGIATAESAVTKIRGPNESGRVTATLTTSVAFVDTPIVFARAFPKIPSVVATVNNSTTGGDVLCAQAISVTTTGFVLRILRADQAFANFGAGLSASASWEAKLNE